MYKIFFLILLVITGVSCSDPSNIGLEVQPPSDNIFINDLTSFNWQKAQTESEDSLRTEKYRRYFHPSLIERKQYRFRY